MLTFDDLSNLKDSESARMEFVLKAIDAHKDSKGYKIARDANSYSRHQNVTIMKYQKLLYTMSGQAVPDNYTANHKISSNFFDRFITQQNQYLLGNGVTLEKTELKAKLGKDFDARLQQAGRAALEGGVAFGFWNFDHLEVFKLTEFVPLYAEETGALQAGVRFWQISDDKPLRLTLYETDGYTEYIKRANEPIKELKPKRAYKIKTRQSVADGVEILDGENYPGFPIVPLWGNLHRQSELVGMREAIDCYDLIKSGFANDVDDASMIYWTLENAGGMDDVSLAQFIERMKTLRAAVIDGDAGAKATAHTLDVPYQAREAYLSRLEKDMYKDFQALDVESLTAGNKTATEIRAAYQPLDNKVDQYEYCVLDFLQGVFELAGIEDAPTFKRSKIVNQMEETQMIMMAAPEIGTELVLKKLPFLTPEEVEARLKEQSAEELDRFEDGPDDDTSEEE